jgi:hypothetical protein
MKRLDDARDALAAEKGRPPKDAFTAFEVAMLRLITGGGTAQTTAEFETDPANQLRALRQRGHALALRELGGGDARKDARALLGELDSYAIMEAHRLYVVAYGLGLAALAADAAALKKWRNEAAQSPTQDAWTEELFFETVRTADADTGEAGIQARAIARAYERRDAFDAAPAVLALAGLCRAAKKKVRDLLDGALVRVEEADAGLEASGPEIAGAERVKRKATLDLRLTIDGDGVFDSGADPAGAFTHGLAATLHKVFEKIDRSRGEKKKLMTNALLRGVTRLGVVLADGIAISSEDEAAYRRRVATAWELSSSRLEGLGSYELDIEGGTGGD